MKRFGIICILLTLLLGNNSQLFAQEPNPKYEMRAVWFTTHWCIDWPTTQSDGSARAVEQQKKEMITILDKLVAGNINTFCMQVRPLADAFYKSELVPWSRWLTGSRGKDPGWDPLAFAVEEGHKRGLELHIWINPYRYELNAGEYGNVDIRKEHPEWLLAYNNSSFSGTILDPGQPEVRKHIQCVIGEIINNYDIDGFIADDYFYPYGGTKTEDAASVAKYKPADMSIEDWRRENVDKTIKLIYDTIQAVKPWIKMGMGPGGIWSTSKSVHTAYGLPYPDNLSGGEGQTYDGIYCNTVAWIRDGYVEYVAPQIYWASTSAHHDFTNLCKWWANVVKHYSDLLPDGKKCFSWPSAAPYREEYDAAEIETEIDNTREFDQMGGSGMVYYNTHSYLNKMATQVQKDRYAYKAILPPFSWKKHDELGAPQNINLANNMLTWTKVNDQTRYTIYAYPRGMNKTLAMNQSKYLLGVSYTNSYDMSKVSNVESMTIAVCAYDRYGNEFAPGTYNEGEEKPLYEITTLANKENRGSVTGGGMYMEGTEIELTAIPKYGYVFTEWEDHSTENPRSVVVTKNATYTAYFEPEKREDVLSGTVTFTNLWTKTLTYTNFMGKSNENRSISVYGDVLYVSDGANSAYYTVDANTGNKLAMASLTEHYFGWHNIRVLPNGRLIGGNSCTEANNLYFYSLGEDGVTDVVTKLAATNMGRTDYFYPYELPTGEVYMTMLSNVNKTFAYIKLDDNYKPKSVQLIKNNDLPSGTSAKAIPADDGSFYASVSSAFPSRHLLSTGEMIESFGGAVGAKVAASGLCHFKVCGHKYMALPYNTTGSFVIYEITDGISAASQIIEPTESVLSITNSAYTVDFAVKQDGYDTYIYELVPNNGIAAYKFTFTPDSIPQSGIDNNAPAMLTDGMVYTISGQSLGYMTLEQTMQLPAGIYLMRNKETTIKILR